MGKVDLSSVIPLYYQIREDLRRRIEAGEWKPGEAIPSEAELQEIYGVSRATVRQALSELVMEGLLIRRQGRGTFVAPPKIVEPLPRLVSFTEEMRAVGLEPSTRSVKVELITDPPKRVRETLRTDEDRFLRIERVRCANGQPIVLLVSYIPASLGIDPQEDFSGSLYALLETKYRIQLGEALQIIEAGVADEHTAAQLEIEEGEPILIIRRGTFAKDGRAVEYVEGFYPADRYRYTIRLER
ncbi:MAG: GntR family transcriptional regulator [Armatimonadota bacterium]|nr:GntR family transcriptional regulator [Armatimonadota bacterium]MDR7563416.1 GntR family transcriptional regulator [Armatimonadota bacterium]MDR7567450.1 GntR family transcriptional regulator [Armatimonadota bacterium]